MSAKELLSFAADRYNCYPAEVVRFYLRLAFTEPLDGYSVQALFPQEVTIESFSLATQSREQGVFASEYEGKTLLCWQWKRKTASLTNELIITTRISSRVAQGSLEAQAALLDENGQEIEQTSLQIAVSREAESLRYLPEIYRRDDFGNRFLMLIDSFWKPISQQINNVSYYFDPHLTPPEFLPWLASWFGLILEDGLPEERRRELVAKIVPIYAEKGTRQALVNFLNLYTGGKAEVIEHRDTNMTLGKESYLGYQIALGKNNRPHSFEVILHAPNQVLKNGKDDAESRQRFRKRIEAIIEQFKPAHTVYTLKIEFI